MSTQVLEHADVGSAWHNNRSPLDRSGLFTRIKKERLDGGELTSPVAGYPWVDGARQVANLVIDPVRDRVATVLARPEGPNLQVYALFSNESYDHQVVRAFAELEVRLRDVLGNRHGIVQVETLPSWALDANEVDAIRLRAVPLA